MYKRSKKILATGLTTALLLTSITIPATAAGDFSGICISARVEEYIAESTSEDPVNELVGDFSIPEEPEATSTETLNKEKEETPAPAEKEETKEEVKEETKEEEAPKKEETVKYPQFKDRVIVTVESGVLNIRESADPEAEILVPSTVQVSLWLRKRVLSGQRSVPATAKVM